MPVMILFPTEKESASLPYSFPHKLFDAEFLTKMVSHKGTPYCYRQACSKNRLAVQ